MKTLMYSQVRKNLRSVIDKVCAGYNKYIITTKDNKSAVIMSYDEYSAMKETMYLLSSCTNRERLNDAVDKIESLNFGKK